MERLRKISRFVLVKIVRRFVKNLPFNQFQILGVIPAKLSFVSYVRIALTSQ